MSIHNKKKNSCISVLNIKYTQKLIKSNSEEITSSNHEEHQRKCNNSKSISIGSVDGELY